MDQICEKRSTTDLMEQDVQAKHHGGVRRLGYFFGMLGLAVFQRVCDAATEGEPGVALLGFIIVFIVIFALVVSRLRNIGMNGWWSLLTLVPIAGFYVFIKCLVCPEGYEDTKKLDDTGKAIAGVCITLILLVVVGVGLLVGKVAHSPSPQQPGYGQYTPDPNDPLNKSLIRELPSRTEGKWIETRHYKYQVCVSYGQYKGAIKDGKVVREFPTRYCAVALYEKRFLKSDKYIGWMGLGSKSYHEMSVDLGRWGSDDQAAEAIRVHQEAAGDTRVIRVTDLGARNSPPARDVYVRLD